MQTKLFRLLCHELTSWTLDSCCYGNVCVCACTAAKYVPLVDDLGVSPRAVDKGYTGRKEVCFQVGKSCFHYQLVLLELSKHDNGQGHSN